MHLLFLVGYLLGTTIASPLPKNHKEWDLLLAEKSGILRNVRERNQYDIISHSNQYVNVSYVNTENVNGTAMKTDNDIDHGKINRSRMNASGGETSSINIASYEKNIGKAIFNEPKLQKTKTVSQRHNNDILERNVHNLPANKTVFAMVDDVLTKKRGNVKKRSADQMPSSETAYDNIDGEDPSSPHESGETDNANSLSVSSESSDQTDSNEHTTISSLYDSDSTTSTPESIDQSDSVESTGVLTASRTGYSISSSDSKSQDDSKESKSSQPSSSNELEEHIDSREFDVSDSGLTTPAGFLTSETPPQPDSSSESDESSRSNDSRISSHSSGSPDHKSSSDQNQSADSSNDSDSSQSNKSSSSEESHKSSEDSKNQSDKIHFEEESANELE